MGIFGFFKKKELVKEKEEKEVVSRNKLSEWIPNKKKENQKKEGEFLILIRERISQLDSELKLEISALENVDFDKKKVDTRIKLIIKENLRNYIDLLIKVVGRLKDIQEVEKIVEKINSVFEDFDKRSKLNYEKVTFLVGKEMQATKESIRKFLKDLEGILKSNSKYLGEVKTIELVENNFKYLKEIEKDKSEILKSLDKDQEESNKLKNNSEKKKKDIEDLKESEKFKQEKIKEQELHLRKQKLEREIVVLRESIDFKFLSNFYHKFENEMKLVKEYRNDFKKTFQGSNSNVLVKLLEEAGIKDSKIFEIIEKLDNERNDISNTVVDDLGVNKLKRDMEKIEFEIQEIESEKLVENKRLGNLEKNLSDVLKKIKVEFEKIDVDFKDD